MDKRSKIYVAGHTGMVGQAIVRELTRGGYENLIVKTHSELDLTDQRATDAFFADYRPEYVFVAAAVVGGILANMTEQARFLSYNIRIGTNVIDCAYAYRVKKLLFLGSSCIYPREAPQPISEEALLTGPLEPTNEGYALAKIACLKLCEYYNRQNGADFISLMPCNLYGYNDNFDLNHSHMLPALVRKFHEAKETGAPHVVVWGTGNVYRELLFADDLAKACVFAMNHYTGWEFLNVGYGEDHTVAEIAKTVKKAVGYGGNIIYDASKPDGMYRKIMDSSKIRALGWSPQVKLDEGVALTYEWYKNNTGAARRSV